MTVPVLSVRNLQVEFVTRRGALRAIDGVSFDIAKGEVLGVVGESGAGKSVTGLAVIGLIDPPGRIGAGQIRLAGRRIEVRGFVEERGGPAIEAVRPEQIEIVLGY